eukprot:SM000739S21876  [mRNA]  locus=s739:27:792:+ [translate_table: standard]
MAASRQIGTRCGAANRAFLDCKRSDEDPAACARQGDARRRRRRCRLHPIAIAIAITIAIAAAASPRRSAVAPLGLRTPPLKDLQGRCPAELDSYVKCMNYYTNEFEFCRKQQAAFEKHASSECLLLQGSSMQPLLLLIGPGLDLG